MIIDLRSDTVTRPSDAMRAAMATAEVGDIQYGDDPTVNHLQIRIAKLMGKESALWLPSGTQANQVALLLLTRPGDDVIASYGAHTVNYEAGGSAKNAGVQFTLIGGKRGYTAEELDSAINPRSHDVYPPTTLIQIENTHNRAGGTIQPQHEIEKICALARSRNISTYLDGARLWNVHAATGLPLDVLARPFELAMVALSKGLGAPGGSMLAGSEQLIGEAVRYRRMLGGAMRQVGFFAAAALHALDNNLDRLGEDHENARIIATGLERSPNVRLDLSSVQTNIVYFDVVDPAPTAEIISQQAEKHGVLLNAMGPRTLRAVTHLDVNRSQCVRAVDILNQLTDPS